MAVDFTQLGPAAGECFPASQLLDARGAAFDLDRDRAGRPAVVVFHRSARW
ncbi:MAG: hypothetical protein ACKVVT_02310 [Dehalococcoidia bacterium]